MEELIINIVILIFCMWSLFVWGYGKEKGYNSGFKDGINYKNNIAQNE